MANKPGPVFVIRLGMYRALVVSNHEAVKECFTTNDKVFASRTSSGLGEILGYNYAAFGFAPYGPLWREMRKLSLLEILSTRRLGDLCMCRYPNCKLASKICTYLAKITTR
ncbi:hypothetical protein PVL29_016143 [Vitis rotundifolia]|uniref:Cytochrome P450 n=1 Tax=Vitis rotundifolia TaxID=103349 RepID=A0AA38ZFM3_VITRO|nr:hypothetical protein PVL29_016143 [Vitis rotundifolia]